jgi:hypothetical protein
VADGAGRTVEAGPGIQLGRDLDHAACNSTGALTLGSNE